jgi:hypothetical protein
MPGRERKGISIRGSSIGKGIEELGMFGKPHVVGISRM